MATITDNNSDNSNLTQETLNSNVFGKWTLKKIILSSVGILALFLVVGLLFFLWGRDIHWYDHDYVIDNEVWGTFGDFCGGVLGLFLSLFGCILMIWTFREQRILTEKTNIAERAIANQSAALQAELSKNSQDQAELQRFNDLFFQLLALYRQQDQDLRTANGGSPFFNEFMNILRHNFKEYVKYGDANRYAGEKYLEFYGRHAWQIAPHFRTLYRIFNLIDSSEINDDNKYEYAKIIRAQLSEGELFFLRYNSMTTYGKNFIEYVNKYRLLKHLPFLSLLEAKKFRNLLMPTDNHSRIDFNVIIYHISKEIFNRVVGNTPLSEEKKELISSAKYKIYLIMRSDNNLVVEMQKNNDVKKVSNRLKPFESLDNDQILWLIYSLIREMFIFSNFGRYNPNVIIKKLTRTSDNIIYFRVTVENETKLRLSHPDWDEKYGISNP